MNIKEAIAKVIIRENLSEAEMIDVMNQVMSGEASPAQIGSFITALRMKSETVEEITGAVRVMREKATTIESGVNTAAGDVLVDTCGTGGDGSGTFNVSTTTAFVVAGAGIPVAKHGNRSVSSNCGSADVLEALGVKLDISPEKIGNCIQEIGIGFLFAPALHGAMKHAIGPRKEMGVRTIFNILGPLTNPASANVQVLGVFNGDLTEPMAHVLKKLGSKRALVVHGEGNLDELTVTGKTKITELNDGEISTYSISPEQLGLNLATLEELAGGSSAAESASLLLAVLGGEMGAKRDMVLLNSGAALMAAGLCEDLQSGISKAAEIIDSRAALTKFEQLVTLTNQ